jgi:hypothetical protein
MRYLREEFLMIVIVAVGCGEPKRTDLLRPMDTDGAVTVTDAPVTTDVAPAGMCRSSAECDDRIPCTDDECVFGGRCEHTAVASRCASGQRCLLGVGCSSGTMCTSSTQCDDMVPCTRDLCAANGTCQNINDDSRCTAPQVCTSAGCAAQGTCRVDMDCSNVTYCDGAERCVSGSCTPGTPIDCRDSDGCTGDICNERTRMCDHPPVSPCGATLMSGVYDVSPAITYTCPLYNIGPLSSITLTVNTASVVVTGLPVMLTGPLPAAGMFSTAATDSRGRTFNLTFQGNFTSPTAFTGAFSVACPDCAAGQGCPTGSSIFTATRR